MNTKERYRTKAGRLSKMYQKMQERARNRGDDRIVSRNEFLSWASRNDEVYGAIFDAWVASGYDIRYCPTIDRIDANGFYEIGNIQFLTHSDNVSKGNSETRHIRTYPGRNKKRISLSKGDENLIFESEKAACDFLGVSRSMAYLSIKRGSNLKGWSVCYA